MKYVLPVILLIPCLARAQQGIQNVHQMYVSTSTRVQTVALCTSDGATNVTAKTSSGTLNGYSAIELYNPDVSTTTAVCGFDPMLSTQPWSVWYGMEISTVSSAAPHNRIMWYTPSSRPVYCETKNSNGCQQLTVIQYK